MCVYVYIYLANIYVPIIFREWRLSFYLGIIIYICIETCSFSSLSRNVVSPGNRWRKTKRKEKEKKETRGNTTN